MAASIRQGLRAAAALVKIHLLRRRVPLFVSWNVTFRCNLRCAYCAACDVDRPELGTQEILEGLDALWDLGTRWITFGGGEPLVREDIGSILQHAKRRGFQVYLSTNGILAPTRADVLDAVDHVNLSMDGPKAVHESARGAGSFDKAVQAIEVARQRTGSVSLVCVLGKHNLDCVAEVLAIARSHGVTVMFQPATRWLSSSTKPNPLAPEVEPYRKTIDTLIRLKRSGAPVRNSVTGLRHLARWPDPTPIWCVGGVVIAVLEADGAMLACHQCQVTQFLQGKAARGALKDSFGKLPLPRDCVQCWCAPLVELGLLFSLRPEPIWNAVRRLV